MHNDPPSPILHKPVHMSLQLGVVSAVGVVAVVDGSVGVDDSVDSVIAGVLSVVPEVLDPEVFLLVESVASEVYCVVFPFTSGFCSEVTSTDCAVPSVLADADVFAVVEVSCNIDERNSDVVSILGEAVLVSSVLGGTVLVENKIVVAVGSDWSVI